MKKVNNIVKVLIILILIITNFRSIAYATGVETQNANISTNTKYDTYTSLQLGKKEVNLNHTIGEVMEEADGFIQGGQEGSGSIISQDKLKNLSNTIYNILLVLAIVIAVILGAILGIRFITEGVEGKAEVKKALIPYILGCVVVFGSFTIWKVVVTIFQQLEQIQ